MGERSDEIDFLMEREYVLQGELDRIHSRLETLLGATAIESCEVPKYRTYGNLIVLRAKSDRVELSHE